MSYDFILKQVKTVGASNILQSTKSYAFYLFLYSYSKCASIISKLKITKTYSNKTEVESVQLGNTFIADMDKCPQDKCCLDKCRGDSCNLLYMFPGPFV